MNDNKNPPTNLSAESSDADSTSHTDASSILTSTPVTLTNAAARFGTAFAGDLLVLIFAVVAAVASFRSGSSEAYYFPRLVSVLLLAFAVVNVAQNCRHIVPSPLSVELCRRLLPGFFIAVVYIYICDIIGFYLSAAAAFVSLSICYNTVPFDKRQWLLLGIAVVSVMGGVYILFDIILKVQTPEPFWID